MVKFLCDSREFLDLIKPKLLYFCSVMNIPEAVVKEASYLIEHWGNRLEYLGKIEDGRDAFSFCFPDEEDTGFPEVYLYDGHLVMTITGFDALNITDELSVE